EKLPFWGGTLGREILANCWYCWASTGVKLTTDSAKTTNTARIHRPFSSTSTTSCRVTSLGSRALSLLVSCPPNPALSRCEGERGNEEVTWRRGWAASRGPGRSTGALSARRRC